MADQMKSFKVSLVDLDGVALPDWVTEKLKREGIELSVLECKTREEFIQVAQDADLVWLLGGSRILNADTIKLLSRCGAILRSGSGTDNVPVSEATRLGIIVANTPEAQSEQVADHTIGLLFSVVRQIANQDRLLRTGAWDRARYAPFGPLFGKALGLVGFGKVPRTICRRMSGKPRLKRK